MSLVNPNGDGGLFERLLRANEEQARSSGSLVELMRQNAERQKEIEENTRATLVSLQKIADTNERVASNLTKMEDQRESAVDAINAHTDAALKATLRDTPFDREFWRRTFLVALALAVLMGFLGGQGRALLGRLTGH